MNFFKRFGSAPIRETCSLRWFGLSKIPMLFFTRPKVMAISAKRIVVKIALRRRTKNHLGSMYFGALSIGADCAVGALTMYVIRQHSASISLIFKDFNAVFHRRAEGNVEFTCDQGEEISKLVALAITSEGRVEMPIDAYATVPEQGNERVATFRLTLSLKHRP